MSRYNQFCFSKGSHAPGQPGGTAFNMDIPLSWGPKGGASGQHPFGVSRELRSKLWRRLKSVSVTMQILDGIYDLSWGLPNCVRYKGFGDAVASELDLRFPGIPNTHDAGVVAGPFLYAGEAEQLDFDGVPGNVANLGVGMSHFANGASYNHMLVDDAGLWWPSLVITGSLSVAAGPEYAIGFSTVALNPLEYGPQIGAITGSVLPDHGGGDLELMLYGPDYLEVSGGTFTLTPYRWFPWDGLYDEETGDPV